METINEELLLVDWSSVWQKIDERAISLETIATSTEAWVGTIPSLNFCNLSVKPKKRRLILEEDEENQSAKIIDKEKPEFHVNICDTSVRLIPIAMNSNHVQKLSVNRQDSDDELLDLNSSREIESLRLQIEAFSTQASNQLPSGLQVLKEINNIDLAMRELQLWTLNDEALLMLCNHLVAQDLSFKRCVSLLRGTLYKKVIDLQTPASRLIFNAITNAIGKHPKPVIFGFLLPLITDSKFGTSQCELVNRIFKECNSKDLILMFLRALLKAKGSDDRDALIFQDIMDGYKWNDWTLSILKNVQSIKIEFTQDVIDALVDEFESQVDLFRSSLLFASIMFTFIQKYEQQIVQHVDKLKRTITKCDVYLKNAVIAKLNKLS